MSTTTLTKVGTKNASQIVILDSSGNIVDDFSGGGGGGGDASAANQLTIIGHVDGIETLIGTTNTTLTTIDGRVDGIEGLLTTIDADTGNISTKVDSIESSSSGTETNTASIDNQLFSVIYTDDTSTHATATSKGILFMAAATPTDGSVTANDIGAVAMTTDRRLHVSVQDSALPTGASTSAKQDTIIGHLDGVEGVLTTIDGDTGAIKTATEAIQAGQLPDGHSVALSATDNAVLDAIAASVAAIDTDTTTLIGHVDGLEALIGTTNTTLTTIDGRVDGIEGLIGTTNTNTGAATTALQLIDDTVQVLGTDTYTETTSKGLTMGAVRRDADTTLVNTTNEFGPLQMDANGRLKVEAFSGETLPVSLASVPSHAVTNIGTFAVQVDGNALTALQLIDDPVFVDDGNAYTLGTSKANIVGGIAVETDGTDPLSVSAEGDTAAFRTDRNRRLLVNKNHPNLWKVNENHSSAQTNNQLKTAPGANLSFYITDIIISNGATAGSVQIVEDEGGTPATIAGPYYFAINGGMSSHLETPIRMTANKSLGFTSTTVTTHTVTVMGYTAP